jgi:hypothetical protein
MRKLNFQCFQLLEEEGQNERLIATGRMARSTVFVSISRRPSSKNRTNPVQ